MLTLQQASDALKDRKLAVVAQATGLHVNTLWSIREGRADDCRVSTLVALTEYFSGGSKK